MLAYVRLVSNSDSVLLMAWRGTEVVITAPTRNRMGRFSRAGSNPALSAKLEVKVLFRAKEEINYDRE